AWVRCRVVVGLVAGEVCAHLPCVPAGDGWAERARAGAPALTRLARGPAAQLLVGIGEDRGAGAVGLCRRLGGERPEELERDVVVRAGRAKRSSDVGRVAERDATDVAASGRRRGQG